MDPTITRPDQLPVAERKVLVAMSGGVDSSVAAARLVEDGWDVAGVTFKLFCYGEEGKESKACCGLEGMRDAHSVAHRLGIPHTVLDMEELFRARVMDDFASEYGRGRTPNPCVQCNTHIKFGPLLSWAEEHGYPWIATGHYVGSRRVQIEGGERTLLERAEDPNKDQSYVLWGVQPSVLERTLFPLGSLPKAATRRQAQGFDLPVWDKEESQDICFVDERGYAEVLRKKLGESHPLFQPGPILDRTGRHLGEHHGLVHYTVGQRKGIGVHTEGKLHVTRLEPDTNTLRVGAEAELLERKVSADDVNLFVPPTYLSKGPVDVKIRYRHEPAPALARWVDGRIEVEFDQPQQAITPGQSLVVYRDGLVLAGGRIEAKVSTDARIESVQGLEPLDRTFNV